MKKPSAKKQLLLTVERIYELLSSTIGNADSLDLTTKGKDVHVTVEWISEFLEIHRSNFYRNVHKKLLKPAFYVGRRPYYLKHDVEKLSFPHEKGAHTFSKLFSKR